MRDLIDRQDAIYLFPNDDLEWDTKGGYIAPHLARRMIEELPSAQPERKTGRWIYKKDLKQFFCDQCGEPSLTEDDRYIYSMDFSNFCPNCGAKMEVEHDT